MKYFIHFTTSKILTLCFDDFFHQIEVVLCKTVQIAEPLRFHEFFRIFSPKIFLVKLKLFRAKQYKVIVI